MHRKSFVTSMPDKSGTFLRAARIIAGHEKIYITHADIDHCGLLYKFDDAKIHVNEKSAESFQKQSKLMPDSREQTELHMGYSKISRIISGYHAPDVTKLLVMDNGTPREHSSFIPIANMTIGDLKFTVLEGSGGHIYGEMIYVCREHGIVFTGDVLKKRSTC